MILKTRVQCLYVLSYGVGRWAAVLTESQIQMNKSFSMYEGKGLQRAYEVLHMYTHVYIDMLRMTIYVSAYFAIFCNFESLKCLVSESKKCLGFFFSV